MCDAEIRSYGGERRFTASTLDRWLGKPAADRAALLRVAKRLRLGENQFRDILDSLEDIAGRQGSTIEALVAAAPLAGILAAGLGRNETISRLKQALRRLRYPQLSQVESRLTALARELKLPPGAELKFPENLEGDSITLTVRARSTTELRSQIARLREIAERDGIDEMFRLLEGQW